MPGDKLVARSSTSRWLMRLLEQPALCARVQALDPAALARVVRHVGLEDAGEIVALASAEQLARIFDEELWCSERPGDDESFDGARFGLWLSLLLESGAAAAAQKLLALDDDFLVMAMSSLMLVVDIDALAREVGTRPCDEDELLEKQLDSAAYEEFEQYRVIAREPRHWESVLALLLELNEQHFDRFCWLLERCASLSEAYVDEHGGLYEVLSEAEALADEAAGAREERREQLGYVSSSSARALLRLALVRSEHDIVVAPEPELITRRYMRSSERAPRITHTALDADDAAFAGLLAQVDGALPAPHPARLPAGEHGARLRSALLRLRERDLRGYDARTLELAFLSNVVLAGRSLEGRSPRPAEAFEIAVALCELGLVRLPTLIESSPTSDEELVATSGLVKLFLLGVRMLERGESQPGRAALLARLDPLDRAQGTTRERTGEPRSTMLRSGEEER